MRTWQVRDVMTREVASVTPVTPYRDIVDVVTGRRVNAVPVLDADRRVLGVVSEADLLHKVELVGEPHERRVFTRRRRRAAEAKAQARYASDLMTAPAVTTYADTTLAAAARTMDREQVKSMPVVDDLGRLVGIVSRGDLLRVHLRSDADIRDDVVREVLRRVLAVQDGTVVVAVSDGTVTMTGRLDRRSSVEIAARLAAQVGGVVEVVNQLSYEFDDRPLVGSGPGPVVGVA